MPPDRDHVIDHAGVADAEASDSGVPRALDAMTEESTAPFSDSSNESAAMTMCVAAAEVTGNVPMDPRVAPARRKHFRTKHRLLASRLFGCLVVLFMLSGENYWSEQAPVLHAGLYLFGCVIGGLGAFGRVWALAHIAGRKRAELVTDGPYSLCRNPIYVSSLLLATGFMLCAGSIILTILTSVSFYALYAFVLRKEECELEAVHGRAFLRYCEKAPSFWPRASAYQEAQSVTICSAAFRRGAWTVALYMPLIGLPPLICALHEVGALPILYTIY